MKKVVSLLMVCMMCVLCFTSCSDNSAEGKIKKLVEEANEQCPRDINGMGEIESFKYNSSDKMIVVTMTFDIPQLTLSLLEEEKDAMQAAFMDGILQSSGQEMLQNMVDANVGMEVKIKVKGEDGNVTLKYTPEEIKDKI